MKCYHIIYVLGCMNCCHNCTMLHEAAFILHGFNISIMLVVSLVCHNSL